MKDAKNLAYRGWRYLRTGWSIYIATPVSIFNFLTLAFLLTERIPWLQGVFPDFTIFALFGLLCFVPSGIILGYIHMKKTMIYGTEAIVLAESNPLTAFSNVATLEMGLRLYQQLGIPVDQEYMQLLEFWRRIHKKWNWEP